MEARWRARDPGHSLDSNTAQTPGMDRKAAINLARAGRRSSGPARSRSTRMQRRRASSWCARERDLRSAGQGAYALGRAVEFTAEAGPGDFIFVPPYVPHQEINASTDEPLECVLVRSDNEAVVVNLDIEPVEKPEQVPWIDPIHKG